MLWCYSAINIALTRIIYNFNTWRKRKILMSYIIIIMSRRLRGYPWPSLAISPYHSSPPAGLQDYNPCPHIAAVCKFVLVVPLLHIHEWGSTGVHRLWARPCFSSSVLRIRWYNGFKLAWKTDGVRHKISRSAGVMEFTNCISTQVRPPHTTSVLDMTLKNLRVWLL